MIQNRIEKNNRKLQAWADKNKIEAYRVYDKDHFVIYDKSQRIDEEKNHLPLMIEATKNYFKTTEDKIIIKKRQKQKGLDQYQKLAEKNEKIVVKENDVSILVNLWDYLDTGLFLDHRPMRYQILRKTHAKKFLNLFCYTASVSVMAALSGATTYSVDMSKNYLEWAKENFEINNLPVKDHFFLEEDVLQFIEHAAQWPDFTSSFDTIFLDPPTFSNSKSMKTDFDVERDQVLLVSQVMKFLKSDGLLYFSNNKRDFKLSPELNDLYKIKDISAQTIPIDFHDQKIHRCFEIRFK